MTKCYSLYYTLIREAKNINTLYKYTYRRLAYTRDENNFGFWFFYQILDANILIVLYEMLFGKVVLFSLENQKVLITGATGAIGRAIAFAMAEQGADVAISGTRKETLYDLATNIKRNTNRNAYVFPCDLSNSVDAHGIIERTLSEIGNLDILINNAGINKDMLFGKMMEEDLDQVMKVNLNSVFILSKNAISAMSNKRFGRIINITSVVAFTGNIGQVNYCASKSALIGMSKSIALEVARKGITVNCIAPGAVNSPMIQKLSDANKEKFIEKIPMKKIAEPEEIAAACCFLASKEAGYITGQTLHVNGGMFMG